MYDEAKVFKMYARVGTTNGEIASELPKMPQPKLEQAKEKPWLIYGLIDPRDGMVRYVGKTVNLRERYKAHLKRYHNNQKKVNWISKLQSVGMIPWVVILEESGLREIGWAEAEASWISLYRDLGCDLTNLTDGGEGVLGLTCSEETRRKISQKLIGIKTGRSPTPWHIEQIKKKNTGIKFSDEHRAKLRVSRSKQVMAPLSAERKKAMQAGRKFGPMAEEHKEKLRKIWSEKRSVKVAEFKRIIESGGMDISTISCKSAGIIFGVCSVTAGRLLNEIRTPVSKLGPMPKIRKDLFKKIWDEKRSVRVSKFVRVIEENGADISSITCKSASILAGVCVSTASILLKEIRNNGKNCI